MQVCVGCCLPGLTRNWLADSSVTLSGTGICTSRRGKQYCHHLSIHNTSHRKHGRRLRTDLVTTAQCLAGCCRMEMVPPKSLVSASRGCASDAHQLGFIDQSVLLPAALSLLGSPGRSNHSHALLDPSTARGAQLNYLQGCVPQEAACTS